MKIFLIIFFIAIILQAVIRYYLNLKKWNNGTCKNCGIKFKHDEYCEESGNNFWKCPKCGEVIMWM